MRYLYLGYKTYSKGFRQEIILVIQMVITSVLLVLSITPFTNYYSLARCIGDSLPQNAFYYSLPDVVDNNTDAFMSQFEKDKIIGKCCTVYTTGYVNEQPADIYFYNEDMFEFLKGQKICNSWEFSEKGVYINKNINEKDTVKIKINSQDFSFEEERTISGKILARDIVLDIKKSGSVPNVECIGKDYTYIRNIHKSHTDKLVIIPIDFNKYPQLNKLVCGAILISSDTDETAESIRQKKGNSLVGKVASIEELKSESIDRLMRTYNFDLFFSALLVISSLFSIGGYSFLRIKTLKAQAEVYNLCGCKHFVYRRIIIVSLLVLLAIAIPLILLISTYVELSEGYDRLGAVIITCIYMALLILVPAVISTAQFAKNKTMEVTKVGGR